MEEPFSPSVIDPKLLVLQIQPEFFFFNKKRAENPSGLLAVDHAGRFLLGEKLQLNDLKNLVVRNRRMVRASRSITIIRGRIRKERTDVTAGKG